MNIRYSEKIKELLRESKLSVTDTRTKILELFFKTKGALEHHNFEKLDGATFDRVTVYRTLQTFLDKGIIHKIPSTDTSIHYALCKDCSEDHHDDHHIHFKCQHCDNTLCLEGIAIPAIQLPQGYTADNVEVIVSGLCPNCK
ncbi:Fur family transcriptional regulator, ferric uptake regulator [Chitinophaga costaii]|uniref:Fur family transcriptional regulator, ferric uptake regulator n=1 Tax=Chitinophaga costaii TaxID=1335309 RepID=A0A1C4AZQ9_9BACT|nr:transcriptional repressor [Chitinophaga costaii]PUZ26814.1 Fur family transcriptional regulator [Chitinophaga costaii]SCC00054.1 Fur family transcriptional regulator, ferric uptake regulator [Chitinophaga costaii]